MKDSAFQFYVQALAYGCCDVVLLINGKTIYCKAGYTGDNPLASLIEACLDIIIDAEENYFEPYYIIWNEEPDLFEIELHLDENNLLHIDLKEQGDDKRTVYGEWHEVVPFNDFVSAIVAEGFRILNAYGLSGYRSSWASQTDFPLAPLLRLTGKIKSELIGDAYLSDVSSEMACLHEFIAKQRFTEETRLFRCTVYYESLQFQGSIDTFSVGEEIAWSCVLPDKYRIAMGIIIDMEKATPEIATHSVTGKVIKIMTEQSELSKGEKVESYNKAPTDSKEIQRADGSEKNLKSEDVTDRIFWGYIVELTDVTIRPIE